MLVDGMQQVAAKGNQTSVLRTKSKLDSKPAEVRTVQTTKELPDDRNMDGSRHELQPRQCTGEGNNSDFGRDSDRPANGMARYSPPLSISITKKELS
jgi:hypothetical protein